MYTNYCCHSVGCLVTYTTVTVYAETRHLSWKSYGRSKLPSSYTSEVSFLYYGVIVGFTLELEYRHARAATAAMLLPLTAMRSNYTVKYADAYESNEATWQQCSALLAIAAYAFVSIPV